MPTGKKPATEAFTQAIAETLRIQKSARRTTNQKIGDATGISPSQVSNYLNGKKAPDIVELDRMSTFLGLDLIEDVLTPAHLLTGARQYE
jgi:transcriptional regulator with XRE-family HTH domain